MTFGAMEGAGKPRQMEVMDNMGIVKVTDLHQAIVAAQSNDQAVTILVYEPLGPTLNGLLHSASLWQNLFDTIQINNTLTELDLRGAGVTTTGYLLVALKVNRRLDTLLLDYNDLSGCSSTGNKFSQELSVLLASNNTGLTSLSVNHVGFGDHGVRHLAQMLRQNHTLQYLELDDDTITECTYLELEEALSHNSRLIDMNGTTRLRDPPTVQTIQTIARIQHLLTSNAHLRGRGGSYPIIFYVLKLLQFIDNRSWNLPQEVLNLIGSYCCAGHLHGTFLRTMKQCITCNI